MKCSICRNNEATVLYREIINGKEQKYALCPICAAKKEGEMSLAFHDFSDPFKGSLFESIFAPTAPSMQREEKRCTLCGSSFRELREAGKVGCGECYKVFSRELEPTVSRLHGNAHHKGRTPKREKRELTVEEKVLMLEKELKAAIADERYEEAATLRDAIKKFKNEAKEG